jgi:hypothetical protein
MDDLHEPRTARGTGNTSIDVDEWYYFIDFPQADYFTFQ